jgi:hypothetical protein
VTVTAETPLPRLSPSPALSTDRWAINRMSTRPPGRAGRVDIVSSCYVPIWSGRQEQVTVPLLKFDVVVPALLVVV